MSGRVSPFALVFGGLAPQRFPEIQQAVAGDPAAAADRDRFVLLAPVGQLLRDLAPDDAPPDAIDGYVRLVHHAYRYWAEGGWTYDIGDAALDRAVRDGTMTSRLPHPGFYLRLPALRVWGAARTGEPPEPLDGVFLTALAAPAPAFGALAALGIFGMHGERPGFSAVAVEGHADAAHATIGETEVPTERSDGSPVFAPQLDGGAHAAVYSVADAGEMLLLVCRLVKYLPAPPVDAGGDTLERVISLE